MVFHPQLPYIMNQIGARRLIVMPDGWDRPRRVRGIDGSSVLVYPLDLRAIQLGKLEEYYDSHADGSFVMAGGDFEQLGDIDAYVSEIARLAQKGKIIRWTTVDRYEQEIGVHIECAAPHPFGQAQEDREPNPSFSRWMTHPQDMVWHGHAVPALDALRAAGFAQAAATIHKLGAVDVPLKESWTTLPDNPWDTRFEEVNEYPGNGSTVPRSGRRIDAVVARLAPRADRSELRLKRLVPLDAAHAPPADRARHLPLVFAMKCSTVSRSRWHRAFASLPQPAQVTCWR